MSLMKMNLRFIFMTRYPSPLLHCLQNKYMYADLKKYQDRDRIITSIENQLKGAKQIAVDWLLR